MDYEELPRPVEEPIRILPSSPVQSPRDSPLTVEQQVVIVEMENLGFTGSFCDSSNKDISLASHLSPMSVFNTPNDIPLEEPEYASIQSKQELTPLFTPIPSVQPMSSPNILLETPTSLSQINDKTLPEGGIDFDDDDDSVADPNYVPSDIESQPSPMSPTSPLSNQPPPVNETNNPQQSFEIEETVSANNISKNSQDSHLPKRNKRKLPELWKKNQRKFKRNSGAAYTSALGKNRPAKKCSNEPCKCQKQCHLKFNGETRQKIFDSFWNLEGIDRQRDFLSKNIIATEATGSRVIQSRRKYTLQYTFKLNFDTVVVCQPFFKKTLDISDKMVRTAIEKARRGVCEIISPDKRGRHVPSNKYDNLKIQFAKDHIDMFPAVPSHWCRKDTKKIYLEPTLNREKLYQLYKEHCMENNNIPICKTSYKELILEKNIDFHRPRKDQCWCHKFEQLSEEEQKEKQEEYEEHVNRKDYAKEEKKADKLKAMVDSTIHVCTFDFEAVLYCPLVLGKPVFYKRKLGCMNFTIHNAVTKQGYCYFWPEYEGNRGANEVSTCLYTYITKLNNVEHLILYSDCCPGQNRNSVVATMLRYIIMMSPENNVKIIDYKFLEPGHTHMECDNMHSTIERASEYAKIYIPEDWLNVIRLARKDNPYMVEVLDHSKFKDFKAMRGYTIKATDGTVLKWANVRWLQVKKDVPNSLFFKFDYWEEFKEVRFTRIVTRSDISSSMDTNLYPEPLPLKQVKYKDLMAMCRDGTIPKNYHSYYVNLPVAENENSDTGATNDDDDLNLAATRASYIRRRPKNRK